MTFTMTSQSPTSQETTSLQLTTQSLFTVTSESPITQVPITPIPTCGLPPMVSAATSVVLHEVATYTCITGYKMTGSPNNMTCVGGQWIGYSPVCKFQPNIIHVNNKPNIINQIETMPLWLMVLYGTAGACVILLLLCCMIALILKCLGCKPLSRKNEEDCEGRPPTCCLSAQINRRVTIRPHDTSEEETVNSNNRKTLPNGIVPRQKTSTVSLPPNYTKIKTERKKAKVVMNTWMPHHRELRPYNTSTK